MSIIFRARTYFLQTFEKNQDSELLDKLYRERQSLIKSLKTSNFRRKAKRIATQNPDKSFWDEIRKIQDLDEQTDLPRSSKNADGKMSSTPEENTLNWINHFQKISTLNKNDKSFDVDFCEEIENFVTEKDECKEELRSSQPWANFFNKKIEEPEIIQILQKLESNKSPGFDKFSYRFWKTDLRSSASFLLSLFHIFWEFEFIPVHLKVCLIKPLLKNDDKDVQDPNNYRPIALLNSSFKIFEAVIKNRLELAAETDSWFSRVQYGFRRKKGTAMQIFNLRESILHQKWEGKKCFAAFMDLSKAFDSCRRSGIMKKLHEKGVRGKIWRVIRACYRNSKLSVKTADGFSKSFETSSGVLQGSMLSPIIFNLL